MWPWTTDATVGKLRKIALDLKSQIEAKDRVIAVMQAEIDSLAAVVARDRQRVAAECASLSRQRADAEGATSERNFEGNGRIRAIVSGV